ncbi:hypothetical protein KIH74_35325 [Kineosporia sp. J2-2]|uniref:Putative Flp pilus-assembly TadG-like N-terminal domain-containing protein n=1 Tax=Kineosporia corallincola TaxID=2835133 RepID=A0ABS5TTZ3_9ACTN|nr:pilus assembly protein TadG-related protein [Kineosporia corallincola]MBT0774269.1 hypothetical protein [Kineosporia corallincola]
MTPRPRARDEGQAGIVFIGLTVFFLVLTGCFVDVSRSLNAHGRSLEVASQAARAAADQITQASLRTGDPTALRIDPVAARRAGQAWLDEAGATGTVTVAPDATSVSVTARIPCPALGLGIVGIRDLSHDATAGATTLTAATDAGPAQPVTIDAEGTP